MTQHMHHKTSPSLSTAAGNRHPLGVRCTTHPDRQATFRCARCDDPFCDHCIGGEEGHQTYCLRCAVIVEEQERTQQFQHRLGVHPGRYRHLMRWALAAIAALLIGFNLFQIFRNYEQSEIPATPVATVSPQLQGIAECRHRLQALAGAAISFRQTFERAPDSLDEIVPLLQPGTPTTDPVTHKPYLLTRSSDGTVTIQCPDPAAHGVRGIEVHPGQIARVIYSEHARAEP